MNDELKQVMAKAQEWLDGNYDEETKAQVRAMMEADDKTELIESFYRTLEFGTGILIDWHPLTLREWMLHGTGGTRPFCRNGLL